MSDLSDDELEGIVYVGEDGAPEEGEITPESRDAHLEGKVESLPPLMTAADLLDEDDPLSSLPVEPPDDDTPPEEATPAFIVARNAYGPGVHSFKLATGQPVGVWLNEEYPELDGGQVAEMLVLMGLDGEAAAWFGKQRDGRRAADAELLKNPTLQRGAAQDEVRTAQKAAVTEAFVKAQKAKERK